MVVPLDPGTTDGYVTDIAAVIGVSDARAAAIASEYPVAAYPSADVAFATLVADANFACPAIQVDRWTAAHVPTFAYEFDDQNAPPRFAPLPVATHSSEIQYLLDEPNAPIPGTLSADQESLAASMRASWSSFAGSGDASTPSLPWPSFGQAEEAVSLQAPQSQVFAGISEAHHCAFWAAH